PASSACNDSAESWPDARAASCCKVQKPSRTARSRRHGTWYPDRGRTSFRGCAARAALKVASEKDRTDGWIIGSNDTATHCGAPLRCALAFDRKELLFCSSLPTAAPWARLFRA